MDHRVQFCGTIVIIHEVTYLQREKNFLVIRCILVGSNYLFLLKFRMQLLLEAFYRQL